MAVRPEPTRPDPGWGDSMTGGTPGWLDFIFLIMVLIGFALIIAVVAAPFINPDTGAPA